MPFFLAISVLALAGFVQGLTGFGFGLVAMALLPMVLGLGETQAVVTLSSMAATLTMTGITLRHVQWSSVWHLWLGSAMGIPVGFALLTLLPQPLLIRFLGLAICLMVLFEFLVTRRYQVQFPVWMGWGVGLLSGTLSGAFNIGGPPMVAYIYNRPWSKEEQVATLTAVFVGTGVLRLALLLASHQLSKEIWTLTGLAVLPMAVAIVCGNRLLKYASQQRLRTVIYLALLALGLHYLLIRP